MALREENLDGASGGGKPAISDVQAEDAFRTILKWIGEDPKRDGLIETPNRMVRAYREYFAGYEEDPRDVLLKTFSEVDGYDGMIVLRGVTFESHCEHHIAPIMRPGFGSATFRTKGGGNLEAGARGRDFLETNADSGAAHSPDRQHDRRRAQALRRRGGRQGGPSLHDRPRRPQARR